MGLVGLVGIKFHNPTGGFRCIYIYIICINWIKLDLSPPSMQVWVGILNLKNPILLVTVTGRGGNM